MEYKYQAIVLGKVDVGETDRMYVFYTKEAGKIRLPAYGVRKPQAKLAGNLETITHAEIFVAKSRGKGRITGVIPTDAFLELKKDFDTLEKVFWVFGIFGKLVTQEEKDERIFNLLLDYLRAMEGVFHDGISDKTKVDILTFGFVFKFFHFLGYGLEVNKCVVCGEKLQLGENFFEIEHGGAVCKKCSTRVGRRVSITDESVKLIRIFLENKMSNLGRIKVKEDGLRNLRLVAAETIRWIVE